MKLNSILKRRLNVPDANTKHPDQLYPLIVENEEMDVLVCGWEEDLVNSEGKATLFWYQDTIAAVRYIIEHPLF
jgi:hypothetical protein